MHKFGRRKPSTRAALEFRSFAVPGAIPVFKPQDNLERLSKEEWAATMNGNDSFGDCVACAVVNLILLLSKALGGTPVKATLDEVVTFYRTQNPTFDPHGGHINGPGSPADGGMSIQLACEELVRNGIKIGGVTYKAHGFAAVSHDDLGEMRAATSLFGGILSGVNMTQAQEQQWPKYAWDYVRRSPYIGGHAILSGGHNDKATDEGRFACWGARNTMTQAFMARQLEEAWVVIFDWHLQNKFFVDAFDMQKFADAYTAITDRPFPAPVTPPVPQPVPVTPGVDIGGTIDGKKYKLVPV